MPKICDGAGPPTALAGHSRLVRGFLRKWFGIDKAIAFNILARIWSSCVGLVTVTLIARFLSPAQQGYYYTFSSLIALQIVFELGFSFVILQMASHERAHLDISGLDQVSGDAVAHDRLASVLQKTVRWYSMGALLLAVFLVTIGAQFFSSTQQSSQHVAWRLPWYFAAISAGITFQLDPLLSFMEGCGYVARVARLRFAQAVTGSLLAWLALAAHQGLFSPAMIILGNAGWAAVWLYRRRGLLLPLWRRHLGSNRIQWGKEVWPFQWRIALSWLCGYFIFQLYNPVLFAFQGPVIAGQMGMSLSLMNALIAVSISWINTKAAPFGTLIARKQFADLDYLFFRALWQSVGVCILGGLFGWTVVLLLRRAHSPLANRVLDPISLALLLAGAPINVITFAQATYLRAHKQEKFVLPSVLGGILVGCSTYFLGKNYGARGVVVGSLVIGLVMGLPMGTYLFAKYRRLWHAR